MSRLLLCIPNRHDGVEAVVQDNALVGEDLRIANTFKGSELCDCPVGMAFYQGLCSHAVRHNLKHVKFCHKADFSMLNFGFAMSPGVNSRNSFTGQEFIHRSYAEDLGHIVFLGEHLTQLDSRHSFLLPQSYLRC